MNTETGKTALITGASSGIGQELAKLFAQDGYNLVLVARSDDTLNRLADVFKGNYGTQQITVIGKDLSQENSAQEVYDEVKRQGITVNYLVNDAGLSTYGKFATETDWEKESELIHLNVISLTHLTKLFLKDMVQRNEGRVLNLSSLVAVVPFPLQAVYAATKAYVYSFTLSMNNELKGTNVTMTALMPNATDTDFFNKAGAADTVVTDELQDPVMVARDGYKALMKGESKVIPGGIKNKMYEVMGYVAPPEMTGAMMRHKNTRKSEVEQSSNLAWGIGVAAGIAAGVAALIIAYNNTNAYDRARYRYKAKSAGRSAKNAIAAVTDSLNGTYHDAKSKVEEALA
ncbi:hypothetical protein GCM10027341_08580 [Spirosoma knui]